MKILVLNAGSSSHKLCLYNIAKELPEHPPWPEWEGQIDWFPERDIAVLKAKAESGSQWSEVLTSVTRSTALSQLLQTLWQGSKPVLQSRDEIDAVGHRVVHGGPQYRASVRVTEALKQAIANLIPLAPVHNPINLEGIELMEKLLGEASSIPQVAVFDTAFHHTLPEVARIYPGPYSWLEQDIRRYGFHGISHEYCAQRAAQLLDQDIEALRLIVCHLGNGGSLAAICNGQSIDTTMGFTPLDGLMMGTRSGAVDPGILLHLIRQGMSADELDHLLNQESGLKGISGVSHDLREIATAIDQGNAQAQLALDLYIHRLKACLGSMLMSLGGIDALIFTGGIGEHQTSVRTAVCESLSFLGLELDQAKNQSHPVDVDIAIATSPIRVLVIHTQEDWAIAKQVFKTVR